MTGPTVSFVDAEPLTLMPGEQATLTVRIDPAAAGSLVRFTLRDDSGDASLLSASDTTDESGEARVTLQAPRQARQFRLRASLGTSTANRAIAVTTMGHVSVQATVLYTGHRTTAASIWTATVELNQGGCQAKPGTPLVTAQGVLPLPLADLPTGTPLLVRVRSGDVVTGCAPLELTPADENRVFEVTADNTPITHDGTLLMTLTTTPDGDAWASLLGAWRNRFRQAFFGGWSGDSAAARSLLDTMVLLAPVSERAALQQARKQLGWDTPAVSFFQLHQSPAIAIGWLDAAIKELTLDPGGITGRLTLTDTTVSFSPDDVMGLRSDDMLVTKTAPWSATLDDKVQLNGEVSWQPALLLARAAEDQAALGYNGGAPTLRQLIDCQGFAAALGGTPSCSTGCLATLCTQSVGEMWTRAAHSDEALNAQATLTFVVSGSAALRSNQLTGFVGDGIWLGTLKDTQGTTAVVPFTGTAKVSALPTSP